MPIAIPPARPPELPQQVFDRAPLMHKWTGWDGSEWLLSDPSSGVRLLRGYRGVGVHDPQRYSTARPGLAGTRRRGSRTPEREVVWNLAVYSAPDVNWFEYDAAFWRTLDPDRPGTWEVTAPGRGGAAGRPRRLQCCWASGGDPNINVDPGRVGFQMYDGVNLIADEQPYWLGDPVVRPFTNVVSGSMYPTAGVDTFVIRISPGATLTRATIDNPGDIDSYPIYTIYGPTTGPTTVGLNGKITTYTAAIPENQYRTIDTRPGKQLITDQAGGDRIADMGAINFAPVPPGKTIPLTMTMVGSGSVTVYLDTLYRRAWG